VKKLPLVELGIPRCSTKLLNLLYFSICIQTLIHNSTLETTKPLLLAISNFVLH